MHFKRSSAILMHITSLPSPYGIGDMGPDAYNFVDFLYASGQKYWQVLPLTPTRSGSGNSPYSSPSAFAGNTLLISPDLLLQEGYLEEKDLEKSPDFRKDQVEFSLVTNFKENILNKAFDNFKSHRKNPPKFDGFCAENKYWLHDYALFITLENYYNQRWLNWPEELKNRDPASLRKIEKEIAEAVAREKFLQFIFYQQWQKLRKYCRDKDIELIGDIPYYVSHDSADCWSHANLFKLNREKQPETVSGVPPDFFSKTGQLWGTPVYDWEALEDHGFKWWINRLRQNLQLCNVVRLDHFRAFSAFWEIPAMDDTAINGKWTAVPGLDFFKAVRKQFPEMPFIAEDLGDIDQPVYDLRDCFELPGMKVLQFAFDENMGNNPFIPHRHVQNCVVYTGTHDNTTSRGWYKNISKAERKRLQNYTGRNLNSYNVAEIMHRLALMSVADLVIIPMQDILGLGEKATMNRPGTTENNWLWRLKPGLLTNKLAAKVKKLNTFYGR